MPADWQLPVEPAAIPASILQWIADPTPQPHLGDKILADLSQKHMFL
ncbi:MAG: hypothetical protein ACK559_20695 [bacterium]